MPGAARTRDEAPGLPGGQDVAVVGVDQIADAVSVLLRLSPEARRAAVSLASVRDVRSELAFRQIARLLLGAELDAAMDAAASALSDDIASSLDDEEAIEEAAVALTTRR